ncbi:SPOR domain-containing protein [Pulveribacter suum]|nr:SPOR domain-containing protein [Pulveribacter suum]
MHASTAHAAYATHSGDAAKGVAAPTSMTMALYRAALGPLGSTEHYLAAFARMDATERVLPGWNGAAAFCTLGWMIFRRLWGELLVYLAGLLVLALLLGALAFGGQALPAPVLAGLMLALVLLAFAVPGLYGDALAHRQVRRHVAAAVEVAPTMLEAIALLERRAADRSRLVAVAGGGAALALLMAVVAVVYLLRPQGGEEGLSPMTAPPAVAASAPLPKAGPEQAPPPVDEPAGEQPAAEQPIAAELTAAEPTPSARPPASATQAEASASAPAVIAAEPAPAPAPVSVPAARQASAAVSKPAPRPASKQAKAQASAPIEAARRLYVNVGLFAEPANARRAHARLRGAGLPVAVHEVTAADGRRLQRVRVGPFAASAEANAAAARIRALGLDAAPAAEKGAE